MALFPMMFFGDKSDSESSACCLFLSGVLTLLEITDDTSAPEHVGHPRMNK